MPTSALTSDMQMAIIMSTVFEKLQLSTEELPTVCRKWGIKINLSKYKVITSPDKLIATESDELKTAGDFCFLGSTVLSIKGMLVDALP